MGPIVPVRVFICDDSLGFPSLIRSWCEMTDGVEDAGAAGTQAEMLRSLPTAKPDVLLLDYMLPDGTSSAELVDVARRLAPGLRVVLISALADDELEREAAELGVDAYCSKLVGIDELFAVVTGSGDASPPSPAA